MRGQTIEIDNRKHEDPDYPMTKPSDMHYPITVKKGQYVVDTDGDILLVTSGNDKYIGDTFVDTMNYGYCRAKYLGCRDDFLGFVNQLRLATPAEIKKAESYDPIGALKITSSGQVALL